VTVGTPRADLTSTDGNRCSGQIALAAYLGNTLRYDVEAAGGLTLKVDIRDPWHHEPLARGTPVLVAGDDVYTNHIHADDLARACAAALTRGLPQRAVHVCDDTDMKMGDYFDLAADLCGLPRPPIRRWPANGCMSWATSCSPWSTWGAGWESIPKRRCAQRTGAGWSATLPSKPLPRSAGSC